jgi:hypothetical protein
MTQNRIDQQNRVQTEAQDPIGAIAGQTTLGTNGRPQREIARESGFGIAWALAH